MVNTAILIFIGVILAIVFLHKVLLAAKASPSSVKDDVKPVRFKKFTQVEGALQQIPVKVNGTDAVIIEVRIRATDKTSAA